MKLPHPLIDSLVAWSGVTVIAFNGMTVNSVLTTCALTLTIVSSILGIYTAVRNLKRNPK